MDIVNKMAPGSGLGTVIEHEIEWIGRMNELLNSTNLTNAQRKELLALKRFETDVNESEDRYQGILDNSTPEYRMKLEAQRAKNKQEQYFPGLIAQTPTREFNPSIPTDAPTRGKPDRLPNVPTQSPAEFYKPSNGDVQFQGVTFPNFAPAVQDKLFEFLGSTPLGMSFRKFHKIFVKLLRSGDVTEEQVQDMYARCRDQ